MTRGLAGRKARLREQRIIFGTDRSTDMGGGAERLTWGGTYLGGLAKGDRGTVVRETDQLKRKDKDQRTCRRGRQGR